jgi:hypothetical protein
MKALYELNKIDKQTYFHLFVYRLTDEIRDKSNEWFEEALKGRPQRLGACYIEGTSINVPR